MPRPRLEEEIDFLAQELAQQEAGRPGLKAPPQLEGPQRPPEAGESPSRAPVRYPTPLAPARLAALTCCLSSAATLGLSERGRGPDLGLPSPRGAPAPTPRPSLGPAVSSGPVHVSPLEPRGGRGDGLTLGRCGRAGRRGPAAKAALTTPPPCSADPGLLRGRRGCAVGGGSLLVAVSAGRGGAGWVGGDV